MRSEGGPGDLVPDPQSGDHLLNFVTLDNLGVIAVDTRLLPHDINAAATVFAFLLA